MQQPTYIWRSKESMGFSFRDYLRQITLTLNCTKNIIIISGMILLILTCNLMSLILCMLIYINCPCMTLLMYNLLINKKQWTHICIMEWWNEISLIVYDNRYCLWNWNNLMLYIWSQVAYIHEISIKKSLDKEVWLH